MARTPTNFSHNNQLSSAAESIISAVPANTQNIVRTLSFYNSGTTTRTVTVYVVENTGSADTGTILKEKAIVGKGTWNCIEAQGITFLEGMTLQADQDAGTDINVNCSGSIVT